MSSKPVWRHALSVSLAAWAIGLGATAVAQQPPTPAPPTASATRGASAGVYTAAQAARGQRLYGDNCQGCHNTGSQSGAAFAKKWRGVVVADLFRVIVEEMPKDAAGSLTPQEAADIIAYLLKLNDLTTGADELPVDLDQLKRIVIDLPGTRETPWL